MSQQLDVAENITHTTSSSSDNQQQRRELAELLARAEVDESGALKLPSLSSLAGIASIGGGAVDILHSLFGG